MDESNKPRKNIKILDKLKSVKHLEIYMAVIIGLILVLVYFGVFKRKSTTTQKVEAEESALSSYISGLEDRLGDALSHISGAGQVTVMITVDDNIEYTYVMNESEKTVTNNGSTTTTRDSEPVIITKNGISSPVILEEKMPEIKGVIIISTGGKDANVRLNLIKAAETLFGISSSKIEVFAGN